MKTYKKTVEAPRLVIEYDKSAESPRTDRDNLGFFFTREGHKISPDGKDHELYNIMIEAADEAESTADHMERIKTAAKEAGIDIVAIYPVCRYEHGGVVYRRGTGKGFDYSNCGFYIVTKESQELIGTPDDRIEAMIDGELDEYTKWANGDVYGFTLYDENGDHEDSCWGFYDLEAIKEHLPDEWKGEDMAEYLVS